jgi:DNA-binding response OmpR family regulator
MERDRTEGPHCLVVEDQALIALSIEAYLEDAGFAVATCATAEDALALVEERTPHCVVLDFALKHGTCLALARELLRRNVPFVVYSGHQRAISDAPELASVPWIDKPAPRQDLIASLLATLAHGIQAAPLVPLDS